MTTVTTTATIKNFKIETITFMGSCGYNEDMVDFVELNPYPLDGDKWYQVSWQNFISATDFFYENDWGHNKIITELRIVFKDGNWLQRTEYDGKEWWEFFRRPIRKDINETFVVTENILRGVDE